MEIRTAEGEILQVKEPVVLNQEGEVILEPHTTSSKESFRSHTFAFQSSNPGFKALSFILGIALIVALLSVGAVILSGIIVTLITLAVLRSVFRMIGFRS